MKNLPTAKIVEYAFIFLLLLIVAPFALFFKGVDLIFEKLCSGIDKLRGIHANSETA
jgi:hypothetical protein